MCAVEIGVGCSEERARELGANVTAAAKAVGLDIDYARVNRIPDTRDAHRLGGLAAKLAAADPGTARRRSA